MKELAINKKARFDYTIEDELEAGIVLEGWEVKSILAKKLNLSNAFIRVRDGEVFLYNALVQPVTTICTHVEVDTTRPRKLLLNRKEISRLVGKQEQKGFTLIPLQVYKGAKIKVLIGVGKGKKDHDKRQDLKDKDWAREKDQLMKKSAQA